MVEMDMVPVLRGALVGDGMKTKTKKDHSHLHILRQAHLGQRHSICPNSLKTQYTRLNAWLLVSRVDSIVLGVDFLLFSTIVPFNNQICFAWVFAWFPEKIRIPGFRMDMEGTPRLS